MKQEMNEKDTEIQMLQNSLDNLTKNEELLANYNSLRDQYGLMSKQVSALHESIVNLTKQVSDRDKLIKAMVNDKYETVSVLSKQLDFLRNLIKQHNLSINLTSDSTENPGMLLLLLVFVLLLLLVLLPISRDLLCFCFWFFSFVCVRFANLVLQHF